MPLKKTSQQAAAAPASTGNAGSQFEAKVGAFYSLTMLVGGEPRGLPGATIDRIAFQQRSSGYPLDDVVIHATNADGSPATLEMQAKRSLTFTASDSEFFDVVGQMWIGSQKPAYQSQRYELAVAIDRTTTRIERTVQEVLHWARQQPDAATFADHLGRKGFASDGMRDFVNLFSENLTKHGAPSDDATVWKLLRRFQVLVFDFGAPGSDYEHRARERCRFALVPDDVTRAGELWTLLQADAGDAARAGGTRSRADLVSKLTRESGYRLEHARDFHAVFAHLAESAAFALADVDDQVGGVRLARSSLVEQGAIVLENHRVLNLVGAPGVGKTAVLKHLVGRLETEGRVIVLRNGRIVPGGWPAMAHQLGCPAPWDRFFNELGAGGGATLFVDNVDQIDDAGQRATVSDLLSKVASQEGWRAVVTSSERGEDWSPILPAGLRASVGHLTVPEISDDEAAELSAANGELATLLAPKHPARSIVRNLFHLSRLVALGPVAGGGPSTEVDLARQWWASGGGREAKGIFGRKKALRIMGADLMERPGSIATKTDALKSDVVAELLSLNAVREEVRGAEVAFRHDVLRDWTVGFMLDDDKELLAGLQKRNPIPAAISRGVEMAARIALQNDPTGKTWLALLASIEGPEVHGSWRRSILLALPRSENAAQHFQGLGGTLIADKGRLLNEIVRALLVVDTEPLARVIARTQPTIEIPTEADGFVVPNGPGWIPAISWLALNAERLPPATIPDVTQAFMSWLLSTSNLGLAINTRMVGILFDWLAMLDEAVRPRMFYRLEALPPPLEIPHIADALETVKTAAFSFALLNAKAARAYVGGLNAEPVTYGGFQNLIRNPGSLAKAAPAEFAELLLGGLVEKDDPDQMGRRPDYGPFGMHDHLFSSPSPSKGPFLDMLSHAPSDGLKLVRTIVEHATDWRRKQYQRADRPFPCMTIPFPDGAKSFEGDRQVYGYPRTMVPSAAATSALMALEAWAHVQLETGADPAEVLADVLGPDGSSCAFVAVTIDLVLSHWPLMNGLVWPFMAVPSLLQYDHERYVHDVAGVNHWPYADEPRNAKVRRADLEARASRRSPLLNALGNYALSVEGGTATLLKQSLGRARDEIWATPANGEDPLNGLHAIADRALRMTDPANYRPVVGQLPDGTQVDLLEYVLSPEEQRSRDSQLPQVEAQTRHASLRASLHLAFDDVEKSTPEIVVVSIAWAKEQSLTAGVHADDGDDDSSFEIDWDRRAVAMAAVLSVRDYRGEDRPAVLAWALSVFEAAIGEPVKESLGSDQVVYCLPAIAAIGLVGLFQESNDQQTRNKLLGIAAHPHPAVANALGSRFVEIGAVDDRVLRSIVRILLSSANYPRTEYDENADKTIRRHRDDAIGQLIEAERLWLDGQTAEPGWPDLPPWITRPRRVTRIHRGPAEQEQPAPRRAPPEAYADERRLGGVASHFIRLYVRRRPAWLPGLARHLMHWTLAANAPEADGRDADGRPFTWNAEFFDFLGILCAGLPHEDAVNHIVGPLMTLGDDAFHDGIGALLRGYDRAVRSTDAAKPKDPAAMRRTVLPRFKIARSYQRMGRDKEFSCEHHTADALTAMFYQRAIFMGPRGPDIPLNWEGLSSVLPVLTDLAIGAPTSGYLALLFLNVIDRAPQSRWAPFALDALLAWVGAYGPDTNFWVSRDVGGRACGWLNKALESGDGLNLHTNQLEQLVGALDVLVKAGVAPARELEERFGADLLTRRRA